MPSNKRAANQEPGQESAQESAQEPAQKSSHTTGEVVTNQRHQELKPNTTVTGAGETSVHTDNKADVDLSYEDGIFGADGADNATSEAMSYQNGRGDEGDVAGIDR